MLSLLIGYMSIWRSTWGSPAPTIAPLWIIGPSLPTNNPETKPILNQHGTASKRHTTVIWLHGSDQHHAVYWRYRNKASLHIFLKNLNQKAAITTNGLIQHRARFYSNLCLCWYRLFSSSLPPATANRTPVTLHMKVRSRTMPGIFTPFR